MCWVGGRFRNVPRRKIALLYGLYMGRPRPYARTILARDRRSVGVNIIAKSPCVMLDVARVAILRARGVARSRNLASLHLKLLVGIYFGRTRLPLAYLLGRGHIGQAMPIR